MATETLPAKAEYVSPIRWLTIVNTDEQPIPPYGLLEQIGVDSNGAIQVQRPSEDSQSNLLVNSGFLVPVDGQGMASMTWPAIVTYDNNPVTGDGPESGEEWGSQADLWTLGFGKKGFFIVGGSNLGLTNAEPLLLTNADLQGHVITYVSKTCPIFQTITFSTGSGQETLRIQVGEKVEYTVKDALTGLVLNVYCVINPTDCCPGSIGSIGSGSNAIPCCLGVNLPQCVCLNVHGNGTFGYGDCIDPATGLVLDYNITLCQGESSTPGVIWSNDANPFDTGCGGEKLIFSISCESGVGVDASQTQWVLVVRTTSGAVVAYTFSTLTNANCDPLLINFEELISYPPNSGTTGFIGCCKPLHSAFEQSITATAGSCGGSGGSGGSGGGCNPTPIALGQAASVGPVSAFSLGGITVNAGELLIVAVAAGGSNVSQTVTWNGQTLTNNPGTSITGVLAGDVEVFYLDVTVTGTSSIDIVLTSGVAAIIMSAVAFSFLANNTQDQSGSQTGSTGTPTVSAGPTVVACEIAFAAFMLTKTSGLLTWGWGSGYTSLGQDNVNSFGASNFYLTTGYKILSSTVTTTATITGSAQTNFAGALGTFS